ncbi:tRNA (adenosine(37)-N6)-dimethylallyltransferase MiaA [Cognatishimia sp. F0-27]|uniref:tRNA (adenosine(37)-N6)-dimethylallyltransferase MiaA n=1 Tax=Cognatishimia sp. F0-27 TaxID=2816855 RepID=UPI001D0C596B|nr:tRNA (adenosine(37)-N6)-dimethylallyltransferase MiaA [Cognatishimia sp. F0-27]MCC1493571.1 tRNA (adenosine(37)-N6)-dimethylallyltransferase MiaA [Cognatishimia sp. F0-27]
MPADRPARLAEMPFHRLDPQRPVLIAGPTASGKSALALDIAERQGRAIVNADALQVFDSWRVLTARPPRADEARVPHHLYGHVPGHAPYSVGAWLADLEPFLARSPAPVIVGGTGLYFSALTEGLTRTPEVPPEIRAEADTRLARDGLGTMLAEIDTATRSRIDAANPARVQRAWEVLRTTGRGLAAWQDETPPPRLPLARAHAFVIDAPREWLTPRIERRLAQMVETGALEEAAANSAGFDPARPSGKAIGAEELIAYLRGDLSLEAALDRAAIRTRQYAKRQRTWFRARMQGWTWIDGTARALAGGV